MQESTENAAPLEGQLNLPTTNVLSAPQKPSQDPPRSLSTRSCNICRRRKVKCDKQEGGCGNCQKADVECVYPGPGRASRRPKVPKPTSEREALLLKRLKRLEGVVQDLSGQVEQEHSMTSTASSVRSTWDKDSEAGRKTGNNVRVVGVDEGNGTTRTWLKRLHGMGEGPPRPDLIEKEFGRLVIDEGKSRYISLSFWSSLNGEVANLRELFDDEVSSDAGDEDYESEDLESMIPKFDNIDHHSFVFGYSSADVDLRSLHPLPSQIPFYFDTFKENVDPLVKMFHLPTMSKTMREVKDNMGSLTKATEALCFSMYYATITSMSVEEVKLNFGVDKISLLKKYRFGTEQALARARFLNNSEIVTLQAFVLFLICVRRYDDSRFTWTLTGIAIRMAQSLGLHRDGTKFDLTPFDTEMRRRLWWQVAILDVRNAEDYGTDPSILEQSFDTQLPLNINDADLDPNATEPPAPIVGVTEMTFCLIRFEIAIMCRRLSYQTTFANISLAEKEILVRDCHERLEKLYLVHCDNSGPLFWVAAVVARLVVAKMGLIIYLGTPGVADNLPEPVKDRLLIAAIESIEFSHLLETEASTKKWGWLFHTYIQWHAIAYILNRIIRSPHNSEVLERGFRAVSSVFQKWDEVMKRSKNGVLWLPMRRLMARVVRVRESQQQLSSQNVTLPAPGVSYGDWLSTAPPIAPDHERLNPIRPLQQGLPQMMSGQILNQSLDQVLDEGFENHISQFFNQQFGQNNIENELTMQYLQNNMDSNNIGHLDRLPGSGVGMMDAAVMDMNMDSRTSVDGTDALGEMSWESFDEMVRDFQTEANTSLPEGRGPVMGGLGRGSWW